MIVIRNRLNQRIIINLDGGKSVDLLAKGTASISERELLSPHLQLLIVKGDIVVMPPVKQEEMEIPLEVVKQPKRQPEKRSKK